MSATVFDALFNGHALPTLTETFGESVVAWESGQDRVTAIQLTTGQSYSAIIHRYESQPASDGNIGNILKIRLWVPVSARPQPQDQWRIVSADNTQEEFTVADYGVVSGGYQEIKLVKQTITRFKSAGKLT